MNADGSLRFAGLLRSEWHKLWTLRTPRLIVLAAALAPPTLGLVRALGAPTLIEAEPLAAAAVLFESVALAALPTAFLASLLGLMVMGAEYADDSLVVTLSVAPWRRRVLAAKAITTSFAVIAASVPGFVTAALFAWLTLSARGAELPSALDLASVIIAAVFSAVAFGLIGVGGAALARSLVGAAIGLSIALALVPSLIGVVGGATLSDLTAVSAVQAIVTRPPASAFTLEGVPPSTLPPALAAVVLACWAAGTLTIAAVVFGRRPVLGRSRRGSARPARNAARAAIARPVLLNVVRAELLKAATAPATWWLVLPAAVSLPLLAGLTASRIELADAAEDPLARSDGLVSAMTAGVGLAQLLLAIFGATLFTSDAVTGVLRTALLAAPSRGTLVTAKLLVAFLVGGAAAATGALASWATIAWAVRGSPPPWEQLAVPAFRSVAALVLITIIGTAIGCLSRLPASAIAVLLALLVLAPSVLGPMKPLTRGTPLVWVANAGEFLPAPNTAVLVIPPNSFWPQWLQGGVLQLTPDQDMSVLLAWAVIAIPVAGLRFARRSI